MKHRFTGRTLVEAIRHQVMVACDERIARRIARECRVREFAAGSTLITQDENSTDIYLILQGSVDVFVNGRRIGSRTAGRHVGEMATILNSKRTATVKAQENCVVASLTRTRFHALAEAYPRQIWRALAEELADRLDKRRKLIREQNAKPYIFIGSSSQQRDVAEEIKRQIEAPELDVRVWSDPDVFEASDVNIETLTKETERADFAIIVFGKDDVQMSAGKRQFVPRDNVVFEAGLFIGCISRRRTFVVTPKNVKLRILTDLSGMTRLTFIKERRKQQSVHGFETRIDVSAATARIKARIKHDWVR